MLRFPPCWIALALWLGPQALFAQTSGLPADFTAPAAPAPTSSVNRTAYTSLGNGNSYFATPGQALSSARPASPSLVRAAPMYGNHFAIGGGFTVVTGTGYGSATTFQTPTSGGSGTKISDNNQTLPQNRFFLTQNFWHNAFGNNSNTTSDGDVYRAVLGVEQLFGDDLWSVEFRLPILSAETLTDSTENIYGANQVQPFGGESIGNLSLILKRLLYESADFAVAGGLGLELPTQNSDRGQVAGISFEYDNQAVHLHPWLGALFAPNEQWFFQGFFIIDTPLNDDEVEFRPDSGDVSEGFQPQTLLHLDFQTGYWFYEANSASLGRLRLAAITEWHYSTTATDTDSFTFNYHDGINLGNATFANPAGRQDIVDMTVGLQISLEDNLDLRFGTAFPLKSGENRSFDIEYLFSLNYYR